MEATNFFHFGFDARFLGDNSRLVLGQESQVLVGVEWDGSYYHAILTGHVVKLPSKSSFVYSSVSAAVSFLQRSFLLYQATSVQRFLTQVPRIGTSGVLDPKRASSITCLRLWEYYREQEKKGDDEVCCKNILLDMSC